MATTTLAPARETTRSGVTTAEVRVLDPIETAGMTKDDVGALRDRTRAAIAAAIADMKAA